MCKDLIFPGDFGTQQRVGVGRMEVEQRPLNRFDMLGGNWQLQKEGEK